jgi:hypothetical protein
MSAELRGGKMDSQRISARLIHIVAVLLVLLSGSAFAQREECTSAVLAPVATESGAPMWAESLRIKGLVRPFQEGNKNEYLNLTPLVNREGGFREILEAREAEILRLTSEFLRDEHAGEEYRVFQEAMSRRAYDALRSVRRPG